MRVEPFTQTIPVWNYEDRTTRVRVAPYIQTVAAYNYENRTTRVRVTPFTQVVVAYNYENRTTRVRVAPFTRTIPAWNYENRTTRVRVAPFTQTAPAFNYENRQSCHPLHGCSTTRVRVAPFTQTVAAYNYENRTTRVRVAPYIQTVPAYNYENRTTRVRVGPYTQTVPAYNYETRTSRVRVAPFTRTIPAWNYENRTTRVRVAPYTQTVPAYNYQTRTRPVPHTHPTTTTEAPTTTAAPTEAEVPTTTAAPTTTEATTTPSRADPPSTTTVSQSRPGDVTGLECTASSQTSLTADWDAVAGADGYQLSTRVPPGRSLRIGDLGRTAATSDSVSRLSDGSVYTLRVVAYNSEGNSNAATVRCRTVSDDWLTVACSASGVLTAEWSDPSGDDPDPSGYYVTVTQVGSIVVQIYSGTSTNMSKTVALGEQYRVSLRSRNGNGGPVYTQTKTHTCPNPPPTTPPRVVAAPTGLKAVCSAAGISMSWNVVPSGQVLSPLRKFNVEIGGAVEAVVEYPNGAANIAHVWEDAVAGTTYSVRVKELSKDTTDPGHADAEWDESPWTTTLTVPCALFVPRNFEVSCNVWATVSAKWEALNDITGYRVEWIPQNETGSSRTIVTSSNTLTEYGDEGGTYKLRLSAHHPAGWSDYSDQTVTCPPPCPEGKHRHALAHIGSSGNYVLDPTHECHAINFVGVCSSQTCREINHLLTDVIPEGITTFACHPVGGVVASSLVGWTVRGLLSTQKAYKLTKKLVTGTQTASDLAASAFLLFTCDDNGDDSN